MTEVYRVAIVGSGPSGLSAAAHAAALGLKHVLLEAEPHLSNTIHRYQKGKHVMAEPAVLPLRSPLPFDAGTREQVLEGWREAAARPPVHVRYGARVIRVSGARGAFMLSLEDGSSVQAERVVLAIGLQGNLRKIGAPGEDLDFVQYQLDDPDEYRDEVIAIVGAGDAAIENALALAPQNKVFIINRRDEFDRAKEANNAAILQAIEAGQVKCFYNTAIGEVQALAAQPRGRLVLNTANGRVELDCDRVIARLGATAPRAFVESCGVVFPGKDANAIPAVSDTYESNVPGLHVIGALAGFPLIKQAINQGYEVIEFIEGRPCEPADVRLLRMKFFALPGWSSVETALDRIQQRMPVLAGLTRLQLREFLLDSELHQPDEAQVIFKRNDYTDSFFSIIDGEVQIQLGEEEQGRHIRLGAGEFFGEMSLISGRRRSATVRAGAGCVLIETPRRSMNKLIASVAAVKRAVDEVFLRRAIQAHIAPGVPAGELAGIVGSASLARFKPGEVLFREDDAGDALHLIRRGSVTVSRRVGAQDVVMAYVPAGQYVGEMALVSDLPRSATATAAVATETIRLDGTAFKALLNTRPDVRERVTRIYTQRLAQNSARQEQSQGGGLISFLVAQGVGEATDVLLIDESLCVRCDHCERACADTHGGLSRLNREAGPTFANVHVPTSCRHCEHPHCMKDCPPDAIKRSASGEVFISDACIGCGNCERNCPYGVIQMGVESEKKPSLWNFLLFGGGEPGRAPAPAAGGAKKAAKCDMCHDQPQGPACVRACPTGAALRVSPERFLSTVKGEF